MTKNKEKFSKNCPKCNKEMFYTFKSNLHRSCRANSVCISCSHVELKNNIVRRNSNFFEIINTEEKSYWLGFLLADGCVCPKKRGYRVDVNLARIDYSHLKKLANIFKIEVKFYSSYSKQQNKYRYGCNLGFSDEKIWNDLNSKGIIHRKTYKNDSDKIFNCIPRKLIRHFIRGYFDGDGTVGWNRQIGMYSCQISFISYTKGVLEKIKKYILEDIGINNNYIYGRESKYVLAWGGCRQLDCLFNYLYRDATVFLERKRKKFEKIHQYFLFQRKKFGCIYNGVYLTKKKKPYRARIMINGKNKSLGCFYTPEEAARAWDRAIIENNFPKYKLNFIRG
jgi:hypothetical protein